MKFLKVLCIFGIVLLIVGIFLLAGTIQHHEGMVLGGIGAFLITIFAIMLTIADLRAYKSNQDDKSSRDKDTSSGIL